MEVYNENVYYAINSSAGVYQISDQRCLLKRIVVNNVGVTTSGEIYIWDGLSTSGAPYVVAAEIPRTSAGLFDYECVMPQGLTIQTIGDSNVTVVYRLV